MLAHIPLRFLQRSGRPARHRYYRLALQQLVHTTAQLYKPNRNAPNKRPVAKQLQTDAPVAPAPVTPPVSEAAPIEQQSSNVPPPPPPTTDLVNTSSTSSSSSAPDQVLKYAPYALVALAASIFAYFQFNDSTHRKQLSVPQQQSYGQAQLGGDYQLTDKDGNTVTPATFADKFYCMYFGFTHCPDICPVELQKMQRALQLLSAKLANPTLSLTGVAAVGSSDAQQSSDPTTQLRFQSNAVVSPDSATKLQLPAMSEQKIAATLPPALFVSVDPHRDTPDRLQKYSQQYESPPTGRIEPHFMWATGTIQQLQEMAKAFRAYMNIGEIDTATAGDDYLVDHSIYWYMVGPHGRVVDFFGQRVTAEEVAERMYQQIAMHQTSKQQPR